jgi:predicted ATP-grasp superfamily ATP-dependent carboligase
MRVFIFEHICGGGLTGEELTSKLVWEGGAMLRAAVEDFVALGHDVVTTLDQRVPLDLKGAEIVPIPPGSDFDAIFNRFVRSADAALVIAPEFHGLLLKWITAVEAAGVRSLGCEPRAIALASDKYRLCEHLSSHGIPTPATRLGLRETPTRWPVVVKPRSGAGCERTFICHDGGDFDRLPVADDWIVQPLIPGLAASAAFIVHGGEPRPLRAGEQFVRGKQQFFYHGGRMPLPSPLSERALALAERAVRTVPGLRGYVGVDLVMGDAPEGDHVIEINPRLSVAYVGLRQLCKTSVAAALLHPAAPLAWKPGVVNYDASGRVGWESGA